jgi:tetratricopeptide (TPR) repeat protein
MPARMLLRTRLKSPVQWRSALVTILLLCLAVAPQRGRGEAPGTVPIGIIVVASLEEANSVLNRLKSGDDFAALAREHSIDPTAGGGGEFQADPENLRLELRDALRSIQTGQVTGIVKIPTGFAILKLLKLTRAEDDSAVDRTRTLAVSGPSNVRLTPGVAGYSEFYEAFRSSIPTGAAGRDWAVDLKGVCALREQAPRNAIAAMQERLTRDGASMEPLRLAYTHYTLAELLTSQGDFENSIREWEIVYRDALSSKNDELAQHMEAVLGAGYLHRASAADHLSEAPIDISRIFPSHPGAVHIVSGDLEKAIEYLTKALKREPANGELQWLLNVAYMTQGSYPTKVPKEFLIPPSVFASKDDIGRFQDVAPAAGLNVYGTAGGVIIDDFDNDGLLDVVTSQVDDCAPLHYFHNNGDGTFTNRAKEAGLLDQTGGLNIIQADYNNDGCVDILVLRGGWEFARRRSLLRNNCDGTFTDVTEQSGLLKGPVLPSQSAVWIDIDNDGNLDLFIANENAPSQLFLNRGDGTFVEISHEAGVDRSAYSKAVVSADYDNDGYPDLYVSNFNGPDFLYHNNGDRTFTEVSRKAGLETPWMSFAAWFFDYDNDGWPDLFVTSYYFSVEEVVHSYMGLPRKGETLKLFKNMKDGTFKDVTAETGLDRVFMPMGANFGDIDNDGFLDIYLGMGNPSYTTLMPNVLLHNQQGKRFVDITTSSGTGALAKGHGVAFADLNNDGDEDLFIVMGGPQTGDRYTSRLFENPGGHGNDWISLHLVGVKSNRSAMGARITVTVENEGRRRTICRTVGSGGSFGGSPLQQHIGLGKSARIENIEVWWPGSKTKQNFANVQPNQFLEIKELEKAPVKLSRHPFRLGGPARAAAGHTGS